MKTTITNLEDLKPGMRTADGHRFDGKTSYGGYHVRFPATKQITAFNFIVVKETAEHIFLNQEVEVPE